MCVGRHFPVICSVVLYYGKMLFFMAIKANKCCELHLLARYMVCKRNRAGRCGLYSSGSGEGPVAGFYDSNEPPHFIKGRQFIDYMSYN